MPHIYVEGNLIIIKFVCKAINKFCSSRDSRVSIPETILGVINYSTIFMKIMYLIFSMLVKSIIIISVQ